MIQEIKLKYYNSTLKIGFNTWKEVYDVKKEVWLQAKEHCGMLFSGCQKIFLKKL